MRPLGSSFLAVAAMTSASDAGPPIGGITYPIVAVVTPSPQRDTESDQLVDLAQNNPIKLLKLGLSKYNQQVRDYSCRLIKYERIDGKSSGEQEIEVKFKEKPYSVLMTWIRNPSGAHQVLYIDGENDGKFLARPNGLAGLLFRSVAVDPASARARKSSLRRVDRFGFANSIKSLLSQYELADTRGELQHRFLGRGSVDGREALVLQRLLPDSPDYENQKTQIYLDKEYLVPTAVFFYGGDGELKAKYVFANISFNVGLSQRDIVESFGSSAGGGADQRS